MRRPEFIAEQSRRPSGALGWLIGNIMSHETESLNAATLAGAVSKREGEPVRVFLIGDGASAARRGQHVPSSFYNIDGHTARGHLVLAMDRRGPV